MEGEVSTLEGIPFLGALLPSKQMLKVMAKAGAGGAIGGAVYELGYQNVAWFSQGDKNIRLAKEAGAAVVLAVAGGAVLWKSMPDMAKGHVGAMASKVAEAVLRFAGQLPARGMVTAAPSTTSGHVGEVRVTAPEFPQLSGRVSVRDANPAAMSAINAFGSY